MNGIIRWNPGWDPFHEDVLVPAMNVYEEQNTIIVETPLPGIDPKEVQVNIERGVLTVQGETKKEHEIDDKNYYRKEIRSGSFFRQVALPGAIKEDGVMAEFDNGILRIRAPKAGPKTGKKIEIKIINKK
jgi:HSP20 family protein